MRLLPGSQTTRGEHKDERALAELYQVIALAKGYRDTGRVKLALIKFAQRHPLSKIGTTTWEAILRLLSSRNTVRRKFWCDIFTSVFDETLELAEIGIRLAGTKGRFSDPMRRFQIDQSLDCIEQAALALYIPEFRAGTERLLEKRCALAA